MEMTNTETRQCAHPGCSCPAADYENYCGAFCESAPFETVCGCGHAECRKAAGMKSGAR
jgi:hypothetical protein